MSDFADFVAGYKLPTTGTLSDNLAKIASDVQSLNNTLQKGFGYLNSMIPMLVGTVTGSQETSTNLTIYNMKQVRDAKDPSQACYQAIVRSQMKVDEVIDGGLLFDPLSGDPSGGIEISLSSKNNKYISELIAMVSPVGSGDDVLCVRPLAPFWEKVNVSYGLADRQSWCTLVTRWHEEQKPNAAPRSTTAARAQLASEQAIAYEKRGSGVALAVSGNRNADNAVMHIFVLEADEDILQTLVDSYLNKLATKGEFHFKVTQPRVYVILLSYDNLTIGDSKEQQYGDDVLTFATMVDYRYKNQSDEKAEAAFIPLYTFVGTDWNFVTEYEVYGRLAFKSTLTSPKDAWIRQSAPSDAYREVLSISTTLFPASLKVEGALARKGKGGEATPVEIIAISAKPYIRFGGNVNTAENVDNINSVLMSLGLEKYLTMPSVDDIRRDSIALKQVRNAMDGQRADYQSLVAVNRSFKIAGEFGLSSVMIRIYDHNTLPLVKNWGLSAEVTPDSTVDLGFKARAGSPTFKQFQAKALSFTGTLKEDQGRELWRRVNPVERWTRVS
jgi:hypothetical protein